MLNNRISLISALSTFASLSAITAGIAFQFRAPQAPMPGGNFGRIRSRGPVGKWTPARTRDTEEFVCNPARIPGYLHASRRLREGNALVKAAWAKREAKGALIRT